MTWEVEKTVVPVLHSGAHPTLAALSSQAAKHMISRRSEWDEGYPDDELNRTEIARVEAWYSGYQDALEDAARSVEDLVGTPQMHEILANNIHNLGVWIKLEGIPDKFVEVDSVTTIGDQIRFGVDGGDGRPAWVDGGEA